MRDDDANEANEKDAGTDHPEGWNELGAGWRDSAPSLEGSAFAGEVDLATAASARPASPARSASATCVSSWRSRS